MPPKKPGEEPAEEPRAKKLVSLRKGEYQTSLNALRNDISNQRTGYIDVQLRLPSSETEVHLQLRCTDAYIVGFLGKDGWYRFKGDEKDGWAKERPSCGVEGNYNKLPQVDTIDVPSAENLQSLAKFEKGKELDGKLIVIAAAVVSESLRFATVATYFTGLFNRVWENVPLRDVVPSGELKEQYFLNWARLSQENAPGVLLPNIP